METALAFLGISALLIVTPGQDTMLTIRNTPLGGRAGGTFTALGVAIGQATWTLAASAGVTALLLTSEPAFALVRLAGAAFLWLSVYALAVGRAGHLLSRPRIRRALDGIVGTVLVTFGIRLASQQR